MRTFKSNSMMQKKYLKILFVLPMFATIFLFIELSLKFIGFDDSPIIIYDSKIEYYAQPKRCYLRFFNKICYNEYAMRSNKIRKESMKFAVIGDSVVNGGSFVDQSETITSLSENMLRNRYANIQGLNISAFSWGPKNQLEYIKRFGLFDSKHVFLVLSSHDIQDMPAYLPIENDRKQEFSTIALYNKFFKVRNFDRRKFESRSYMSKAEKITKNHLRLLIQEICLRSEHFDVIIHPEISEISRPSKRYIGLINNLKELQNKKCPFSIVEMAKEPGFSYDAFRDYIHINAKGNDFYAKTIERLFTQNHSLLL